MKMADALNLKKMKVADLKKELSSHGLDAKGNKSELQERLKEFLQQQGLDIEHNDDPVEDDVEDDLEQVTTGDDEEEISDDVLAEENLEQKPDTNKEKSIDDSGNKTPLSKAVDPKEEVKSPITKIQSTALTTPTTEQEKKLQRMKRFGSPSNEEDKKLLRSQRLFVVKRKQIVQIIFYKLWAEHHYKQTYFMMLKFGTSITSASSPEPADLAKLKKRAERFGAVSPVVSKIEDQNRLLKRKERFGASLISMDDSLDVKKKKRAERFSS